MKYNEKKMIHYLSLANTAILYTDAEQKESNE